MFLLYVGEDIVSSFYGLIEIQEGGLYVFNVRSDDGDPPHHPDRTAGNHFGNAGNDYGQESFDGLGDVSNSRIREDIFRTPLALCC